MPEPYLRPGSTLYQVRVNGRRVSTGERDLDKARAVAARLQAEADAANQPGGLLLSAAHELFRAAGTVRQSSMDRYRGSYRQVVRLLGDKPLNRITVADLREFAAKRRTKVKTSTILRDLAYLSSLYSWVAAQDGHDGLANPVKQLDKRRLQLKESRPRDWWLTEDQFEALLPKCRARSIGIS